MINNIFEDKSADNTFVNKEETIREIYMDIVINNSDLIRLNKEEKIKEKINNDLIEKYNIIDKSLISKYIKKILNKMFGYDFLQKYIEDKSVTDIRVVEYNRIYIKKFGKWIKIEDKFKSNKEFTDFIMCTVIKNGGKINYDSPIAIVVDKKFNLRIEAGITPVNSQSPSLVIRIHRNSKNINLSTLCNKYKMFNKDILDKILEYVNTEKNIVISGKGGSGKTTLLRAIINEINDTKAISTNEESTELYIKNKNIIQREIIDNKKNNNITLESLTKESLITSNDIIVVGELKRWRSYCFF